MNHSIEIELLDATYSSDIVVLTQFLNPDLSTEKIRARLKEMLQSKNCSTMGLFVDGTLIGVCSIWLTTRIYSGKQAELDNFVIHPELQSLGFGTEFLNQIEEWAKEKNCSSIELNTYVSNTRSHTFYEREGFVKLGHHYVKKL